MYLNSYWAGNQEGDLVSANFELKVPKNVMIMICLAFMETSSYLQDGTP